MWYWYPLAAAAFLTNATIPALIHVSRASKTLIGLLRLAIATSILTPFVWSHLSQLSGAEWWQLIRLGVWFGFHWECYNWAAKYRIGSMTEGTGSPAGAAVGFSTFAVFAVIVNSIAQRTLPSLGDTLGMGLGMVGALMFFPRPSAAASDHDRAVRGAFLIGAGGAFFFALVSNNHSMSSLDWPVRMWGQFLFAMPWFVFQVIRAPQQFNVQDCSGRDWLELTLFVSILCTLGSHSTVAIASKELGPPAVGMIGLLFVPASMIASVRCAGESITPRMIRGATIIVLANLVAIVS